ncbi:uncharacterized protein BO80DRAFT_498241 [Aspergillus ibericus CBS 121593]|uniref:C2 domain-containing protein n=1 Tax=Aspergillus ibericus CBS 121593 TaxID=1448316 RepID=A0A395HG28_9EURO|nr:hypothetical protein BO80DRAFT_498241 [Aspergillus ibericus CBS 121593]RAL06085.1 hypothetical protein BO80DRAFT_498241 [Aspergillus ibericus CBS 121593]
MDARAQKRVSMAHAAHAAGIFADMSVDGPAIGTLVVIVDRAKNLPNRKTMGKQNPYCAARLGKEAKKTETDVRGGQTPRWDQELRFTVHGSPDYFRLKVSVFNDEKKTDLIGETWIDLKDLIIPGGSQNDHWHPLQFRGKYAGEVRLEMTYYDTRPEDEAVIERRTHAADKVHAKKTSSGPVSTSSSSLSGPRQLKDVKRRPLPSDPRSGNIASDNMASGNMASGNMIPSNLIPSNMIHNHMASNNMTSGNMASGNMIPSNMTSGNMASGNMIPSNMTSGNMASGNMIPGSLIPGNMIAGSKIPGSLIPGNTIPDSTTSGSTTSGSESCSNYTDHCDYAGSSDSLGTESSYGWPFVRPKKKVIPRCPYNSSDSECPPLLQPIERKSMFQPESVESSDSALRTTYYSSPDMNKLLDEEGFVKSWRHYNVKYNRLPSSSEESFSPVPSQYRHTRERETRGYSPTTFSDSSNSTYALLQPRVEDEEEDGPPPPPPVHRSIPDYQIVPRRKSVSPRPPSMRGRGASPTPFSPDSYGTEAAREPGPIIGDDGREIDPSDHLPTNTWAPEPERKTKKPGVVVRFRNPLYRGSPQDYGHRKSMSETYSTSSSSLYAEGINPPIPSKVPVGLPHGNYTNMDGNIDALRRELNAIDIGTGRNMKHVLLR